jgi:hypothetical protein
VLLLSSIPTLAADAVELEVVDRLFLFMFFVLRLVIYSTTIEYFCASML